MNVNVWGQGRDATVFFTGKSPCYCSPHHAGLGTISKTCQTIAWRERNSPIMLLMLCVKMAAFWSIQKINTVAGGGAFASASGTNLRLDALIFQSCLGP